MNPYDVGNAFAEIEEELIASMIRNMKRHRAEETAEGLEWSMWQAEQLKALDAYKKKNKKRFKKQFADINDQIEKAIKEARAQGNMDAEVEILEAIKKGFTGFKKADASTMGEFFKVNDRKLNALIKATKKDFVRGEHAILRMAEDQYRQVIFNAQVYANTGAGTYEQAVDMATKDFLSRGINCIEYKNGARHTMQDYADMAIRTAAKRAYLAGEGEKRAEWGISTVIVNKRGNACPKCVPFVGKVLIDDVYSGGSKEDGDYPLLSRAMELGLYHPRCKDAHSTYFEGISTPPDNAYTKADIEEIKEEYSIEQKRNIAQRNYEKYSRLAERTLDDADKASYATRAEYWMGEYQKYYKKGTRTSSASYRDREQLKRYQAVLGDNAPKEFEKFLEIKYNNKEEYGKLKHAYRITNQYEHNSGNMDSAKVVELHDKAVDYKAKFTGKARKKGNLGIMELDGKTYVASSAVDKAEDPGYINFKGDKDMIVLKPESPNFKTREVGTHNRDVDSEYKLLEHAAEIAKDGKPHKIELLSEKAMCESCQGVLEQFKEKYPNVEISVVSHKKEKAEKNHNNNTIFNFDVKRKHDDENH